MEKQLELGDAVANLRAQLARAVEQSANETIRFEMGAIEMELQVALTISDGVKAEAKWWVVSFGADVREESKATHRIKLTLTPKTAAGRDIRIASKKKVR